MFQTADFCSFLNPLIPCTGVVIFLQPVSSYQSALTNRAAPAAGSTVNPGASGSLMLLQAYYTPNLPLWPLNQTTIVGSAAFLNEY